MKSLADLAGLAGHLSVRGQKEQDIPSPARTAGEGEEWKYCGSPLLGNGTQKLL
ncbi:MAG TPA: hypothetical protein VGB21_01030 [Candidatus Methylomirabilis sp.]